MMRTNFIGTVLVIVLGVNLGAWTLSVATNPATPLASVSVPVGSPAMDARSQSASADVAVTPVMSDEVNGAPAASTNSTATSTEATSSSSARVQ